MRHDREKHSGRWGPRDGHTGRHRQRGAFLIGATVAVAILGMLIAWGGQKYAQEMRISKGERVGEALRAVGEVTQDFIVKHHDELANALSGNPAKTTAMGSLKNVDLTQDRTGGVHSVLIKADTIPTPRPLTIGDIFAITNVSGGGDKPPVAATNYVVKIYGDASNCTRRTIDKCDVEGVVYIDKAVATRVGTTDFDARVAGAALRVMGPDGGFKKTAADDKLTFPNMPSSTGGTQPPDVKVDAALPAGILGVRVGYAATSYAQFLRIDGSRKMTGKLQMGGNDIGNAKDVEATGKVSVTGTGDEGGVWATRNIVAGYANHADLPADAQSAGNVVASNRIVGKEILATDGKGGQSVTDLLAHLPTGTSSDSGNILGSGWVIAGKGIASGDKLLAQSADISGKMTAKSVSTGKLTVTQDGMDVTGGITSHGAISTTGLRSNVQAAGQLQTDEGIISFGAKRATENAACAGNIIGLNSSGEVMSCQGNVWKISKRITNQIVTKVVNQVTPYTYAEWTFRAALEDGYIGRRYQPLHTLSTDTIGKIYPPYPSDVWFENVIACRLWPIGGVHFGLLELKTSSQSFNMEVWTSLDDYKRGASVRVACISDGKRSSATLRRRKHTTTPIINGSKVALPFNIPPDTVLALSKEKAIEMMKPEVKVNERIMPVPQKVKSIKSQNFFVNDCNPGSGGRHKQLGKHWDQCILLRYGDMRDGNVNNGCALPNQNERVYRDDSTGEWMLFTKQVTNGASCVQFVY